MIKKDKNNLKSSSRSENVLFSNLKKFWKFLWYDDSLLSYVLNLALAFIVIKFLFFPGLSLLLNNDYPVVAIVSGSMEHGIVNHQICDKYIVDVDSKRLSFDDWWSYCGSYYINNYNLTKDQFDEFKYSSGLYIGDIMVLYGKDPAKIEVGEVLVFIPGDINWFNSHGPVIHRVVEKWQDDSGKYHFKTKGDHNRDSSSQNNFESDITEDRVIGVGVIRVPFVGYVKIWLVNILEFIVSIFR